jgi:hypothetical protein
MTWHADETKAWLTAVVSCAVLPLLSSCVPAYGYANNKYGDRSRAEFCDSVRRFVRAPLDSAGLRRAWFLPMGAHEEGDEISIDFYAPMASDPSDAHSHAFYRDKVGQLTHYTLATEHGFEMGKCLASKYGFERQTLEMPEDRMRGSFVDKRLQRRIEIQSADESTSILVASLEWKGNVAETMQYRCTQECQ